jgi:hypothetical protein
MKAKVTENTDNNKAKQAIFGPKQADSCWRLADGWICERWACYPDF